MGDDFCYFPVGLNGPFVVEDAVHDPRTAGHPAIAGWGVGAWAGFPILSVDQQPVGWTSDDTALLALRIP